MSKELIAEARAEADKIDAEYRIGSGLLRRLADALEADQRLFDSLIEQRRLAFDERDELAARLTPDDKH